MYSEILPYRDRLPELRDILLEQGSLGLLLVDVSDLTQVEHDYGTQAFETVLSTATELVTELRGAEVRTNDIITVNDKGGDAFLVFLMPKRTNREGRTRVADLQAAAKRVEEHLNRRLAKLNSPYLRGRRRVIVGFALVFFNPLIMPERLLTRLVSEAWESVRIQRMQLRFQNRCRMQEVLLGDQIRTVFQPVIDLQRGGVVGYEALTRGPAGTDFQSPLELFGVAADSDLVFELDRACRLKALQSARELDPALKLFVNVLPATMYDPDFRGPTLIKRLEEMGLSPDRIVLEISEKYMIENYTLFVETLKDFTNLGFSIAVDDIGAGYSGLEKIANLNARYLKFDMQLVRDIDTSYIRQEMARAIKAFADKTGSAIIAEGIERDAELKTLVELGIEYGQGYLLGRPGEMLARPDAVARVASGTC